MACNLQPLSCTGGRPRLLSRPHLSQRTGLLLSMLSVSDIAAVASPELSFKAHP